MALCAIVLLFFYFAIAFGLRVAIQWRLTGDSGLRGIRGRVGSTEWFAGVLFVVALAVGPIAALLVALRADHARLDSVLGRFAGFAFFLAGIALTFIAQLDMGRSWRVGVNRAEKTDLITGGLYALIRNPIYTGMMLAWSGLVLLVPTALCGCSWLLLLLSLELQVRVVEEPYLRATHGEIFAAYAANVGRFLPGIGKNSRAT